MFDFDILYLMYFSLQFGESLPSNTMSLLKIRYLSQPLKGEQQRGLRKLNTYMRQKSVSVS